MNDTAIGFALIGIAILVVLGVVFVLASRGGPAGERPRPPRGVHLPPPSFLPSVFAAAAALIGAGLAFRGDDQLANPWLAIPGLLLLALSSVAWVRAANREWHDVEHGSHDDAPGH